MANLRQSLRIAVTKRGITVTDLAEQMGVNRKTLYSAFHTGNPGINTITRVAEQLNMKTSEFIALGEA